MTVRAEIAPRLGAVVVNHNAGDELLRCVASLRHGGLSDIVVVDNASSDGSLERLATLDASVTLLPAGRNLGYGSAANLGVRRLDKEFLLVCNPDLVLESGAPAALVAALVEDPELGVVGPLINEPNGDRYPSARTFPSYSVALGHALFGVIRPDNPWTRQYQRAGETKTGRVDWVSGACLCVRGDAFRSVDGFDEGYFMYVEDLDLCWRAHRAGWSVGYVADASVTHVQGISTARHPYRMIAAHHASTLRFARRSVQGPMRVLLPFLSVALFCRALVVMAEHAFRAVSQSPSPARG